MKSSILDGRLIGSYLHHVNDLPLVFVHAGFRPEYLEHVASTADAKTASHKSNLPTAPEYLVDHINKLVMASIRECRGYSCLFEDEAFQAGSDRGGRSKEGSGPVLAKRRTQRIHLKSNYFFDSVPITANKHIYIP